MAKLGYGEPIHLMTSGGSLASLETAARFPVRLVESGPAGGAILAGRIALERGERRILSFDMGGTTAKICLIDDGEPLKGRAFEVDRQSRFKKGSGTPVRIPVIEMVEIGAGGGSIARVDALQRILVGPDSAGAEPGPACYGRGGTEPTVTDADLVIGKIDAARFAGGKIAIDSVKAERALAAGIGAKLSGMAAEQAAVGVAEIVDENMANAARVHAVERGVAIRGAHAGGLRRRRAPARKPAGREARHRAHHRAAGCRRRLGGRLPGGAGRLRDRALALHASGHLRCGGRQRARRGHAAGGRSPTPAPRQANGRCSVRRSAFMRYAGQGHEITVALPDRPLAPADAATFRQEFEREYTRLFARHIPNAEIEIMSWVVLATTATEPPARLRGRHRAPAPTAVGERCVFDARLGRRLAVPVFERDRLAPGATLPGPALIVEEGTSTYVSPSFDVSVDAGGALVLCQPPTRAVRSRWDRNHIHRTCHPGACHRDPSSARTGAS